MSVEHLWYQHEIEKQGQRRPSWKVVLEDYESKADVLISNVATNRSVAIEIQRWDTDIAVRTQHRLTLGHEVIWLITDSARLSPEMKHQVFNNRGSFIRVRPLKQPYGDLQPWEPNPPKIVPVMEVSGTVGWLDKEKGYLRTRPMPLMSLLEEILDGKREWKFPGESIFKNADDRGRKGGCWVRSIDYYNVLVMASGLDLPLMEETSRLGRLSVPIQAPFYPPEED